MDSLTKDELSRQLGILGAPPEEFFASHSAFAQSNMDKIRATYTNLTEHGHYNSNEGRWQFCGVQAPSSDDPPPGDCWAALIDQIFSTASSCLFEWTVLRQQNGWRSHVLTLVEGQRKLDIVFVPKPYRHARFISFGAVLTYIGVREGLNEANFQAAKLQLQQCAGLTVACQINRNFFLGAVLLDRTLVLILFARGSTFYSKPFNVDKEPILFIQTVIALSSGFHPLLGLDSRFISHDKGMHLLNLGSGLYTITRRTLVRYVCMNGRGTRVLFCRDSNTNQVFALKDCWLPCDGPNDVTNNTALTSRKPRLMSEREYENFGKDDKYGIFHDCRPTQGTQWDYHATFSEVEEARQRYTTSLQEADKEPGMVVLEALQVAALLSEEGKTSTSSSGGLVDVPTIRELTGGGSTTNKQKLQQPPPSTARSSSEGPPKRLQLDEEGTSGGEPSAMEIDGQSTMQSNPSTSKGNPRLRRGKGRSLKGGRKSKSSKK